jgi:hypothetical protein
MSKRKHGDQYVPKHTHGSIEEEYLTKEELAETRKAIMRYKLRDPGPSIYSKRKNKSKTK